ncbi:MAG: hypothetical protein DYH13_10845 [Alphaproteobacteria bacterium PRO2]|nr:hypothetical protein [Alphaproteobacteria bacterium PRO2]
MNKKTALLVLPLLSTFLFSACDSSDKGGYRPPSFKPETDSGPVNKKDWEHVVGGASEPAPSK